MPVLDRIVRSSDHAARLSFSLFAVPFVVSLSLGGGTGVFETADVVAEALCLPFLVGSLVRLLRRSPPKPVLLALGTAGLFLLLPLIQLAPLPPSIWTKLGGREAIASAFALAGVETPWLGISLFPAATWRSILALTPALAVFAGVMQLDFRQRRMAAYCLIGAGFVTAMLAIIQLVQGPTGLLRVHHDNLTSIVAFFANPNHIAALLYCCILIAVTISIAQTLGLLAQTNWRKSGFWTWRALTPVFLFFLSCLFLFGVALTRSRAGVAITMASILCAVAATLPYAGRLALSKSVIVAGLLGAVIAGAVLNYSLYDVLQRLQGGLENESRVRIAQLSGEILREYMPFGAGIGTFLPIYGMHETVATALHLPINRAHNEFLEWGIEGGVSSYLLLVVAICWLAWLNAFVWIRGVGPYFSDACLTRACAAAPALLLVHSLVDYPFRTIALMSVGASCFSMALAAVADPDTAVEMSTSPHEPSLRMEPRSGRRRSRIPRRAA